MLVVISLHPPPPKTDKQSNNHFSLHPPPTVWNASHWWQKNNNWHWLMTVWFYIAALSFSLNQLKYWLWCLSVKVPTWPVSIIHIRCLYFFFTLWPSWLYEICIITWCCLLIRFPFWCFWIGSYLRLPLSYWIFLLRPRNVYRTSYNKKL